MPARALPRRADAWKGGFAIASPKYTSCIAAEGGVVLAASNDVYRLLPGATGFQRRDTPAGFGDAVAVAVEPRSAARPGKTQRYAVATLDALHIYADEGVASVVFPPDHGEPQQLVWAPRAEDGDATPVLYVRFPELALRLVPSAGAGPSPGDLQELDGSFAKPRAIATDGAGGIAYAIFDEEDQSLDVWLATDVAGGEWHRRSIAIDWDGAECCLAIARRAVAVSFETGGVWLTRDITKHDFAEVEALRSMPWVPEGTPCGHAIAFEGAAADAALFGAVQRSETETHLVRVDAEGQALRIGEIAVSGDDEYKTLCPIRAMAWDATRRTLFSAAGAAGVLCTTAPGAPAPVGPDAAAKAAS